MYKKKQGNGIYNHFLQIANKQDVTNYISLRHPSRGKNAKQGDTMTISTSAVRKSLIMRNSIYRHLYKGRKLQEQAHSSVHEYLYSKIRNSLI